MKKVAILLMCAIFLGFVDLGYAAPVGSVNFRNETDKEHFKIGYFYEYIFEREMEENETEIENYSGHFAKASYLIEDRVELYGLAGMMQFALEEQTTGLSFDTEYVFTWGGGASLAFLKTENGFALGLNGQYRRSDADLDEVVGAVDDEVTYEDWHAALIMSQKIKMVTPYIGVKYSDVRISDATGFADNEADRNVGPFAGIDVGTEDLVFNIEGRFVDELAVSGRIEYKF